MAAYGTGAPLHMLLRPRKHTHSEWLSCGWPEPCEMRTLCPKLLGKKWTLQGPAPPSQLAVGGLQPVACTWSILLGAHPGLQEATGLLLSVSVLFTLLSPTHNSVWVGAS